MIEAITNRETGKRKYAIHEATPPRYMWSLTTLLGCGDMGGLTYAAGSLGVEATLEVVDELGDELCRAGEADRGLVLSMLRLETENRLAQRFGRAKTSGKLIPPHVSRWKARADVGTTVHGMIERDVKRLLGMELTAPSGVEHTAEEEEQIEAAFEGWRGWTRETDFAPLASEAVVWCACGDDDNEHDYACRIDLASTVGGVRAILDVKTGKLDKDGPYLSQWMQVEAQRRAANARGLCGGDFALAGILHVPTTGKDLTPKLYLNDRRDRDDDFQGFDHLAGYALRVLGSPGLL